MDLYEISLCVENSKDIDELNIWVDSTWSYFSKRSLEFFEIVTRNYPCSQIFLANKLEQMMASRDSQTGQPPLKRATDSVLWEERISTEIERF